MVPGAHRDGAKVDTTRPEEAREAEASIVLGEALVESVPTPIHALKVGQMGGGMTEASPIDAAMARTLEPELLASSTIRGSTPEGVLVTEEVPLAPVGPTPTVAMAEPSIGARPSWSLAWLGDNPLAWGGNRLH